MIVITNGNKEEIAPPAEIKVIEKKLCSTKPKSEKEWDSEKV